MKCTIHWHNIGPILTEYWQWSIHEKFRYSYNIRPIFGNRITTIEWAGVRTVPVDADRAGYFIMY